MKRLLLNVISIVILMFAGTFGHMRVQAQASQPNVMFIIVDDLRPQLGVYGHPQMKTPNMDALANRGMLFDNAYIMQATCAPSRACMMTGLRPDSTGIYDLETPVRQVLPDVLTLPEYFKKNGYETISIGKVYHDVADDPQGWTQTPFRAPEVSAKKGYQTKEAQRIAAANPFGPPYEKADVPDNAYADGKDTDYAIQVLQKMKAQNKPFFMAFGLNKPHLPFTAPKKYWDLYSPEDIELSLATDEPIGMSPFSLTTWGELRRWAGMPKGENPMPVDEAKRLIHGYYAATSYSDAQIGKVLAELDRLGMSNNTIVVLIGDHGWKLGDHSAWSKHSNFEIDTRVPMIIRTPAMMTGQADAGLRTDTIVESIDLYPTIAELAGLPIPTHVEGESLVPLLKDPEAEGKGFAVSQFPRGPADGGNNFTHRDEYGLTDERLGEGIMGYGLRVDGFRYVEWFALSGNKLYPVKSVIGVDVPTRELYDETKDPLENVNVVHDPAYSEIVARLASKLRQQLGDKVGELWVGVPELGQVLDRATPLQIGALHSDYAEVGVELDGKTIFNGTSVPQELAFRPEELNAGKHNLTVFAKDKNGVIHKQSTEFAVEHVRLSTTGDKLANVAQLYLDLRVPGDQLQNVVVTLNPVSDGTSVLNEQTIYSGTTPPGTINLDTLAFADGAYDVVATITTNKGIKSSSKKRVVIQNWNVLEDAVLPPSETQWFGLQDRMEVTDRSNGWQFTGDAANELFGDTDRMKIGEQSQREYLTWDLDNLHDFSFTVYTKSSDLNQAIEVAVSTDGSEWTIQPYTTRVVERSTAGWIKVQVEGRISETSPAKYVRLSFLEGAAINNTELGHVLLRGVNN